MKQSLVNLALLLSAAVDATRQRRLSSYRPRRVAYRDILKYGERERQQHSSSGRRPNLVENTLLDALLADGVVSVIGVPEYERARRDAFSWDSLHRCAVISGESSSDEQPSLAYGYQKMRCPDGTIRRTLMANSTVPGPEGDQQMSPLASTSSGGSACESFAEASGSLRASISKATEAFAATLSSSLGAIIGPIFTTKSGRPYETFREAVEGGKHMEHFHSYQHPSGLREGEATIETIGMHTDQGLITVFAPGQVVGEEDVTGHVSGGFYVSLPNGTDVELLLDGGDLVFMLGTGFDEFVRPNIVASATKEEGGGAIRTPLPRATPHALVMPPHSKSESRTWYGRMIMPPFDAYLSEHGMSYGELKGSGKLPMTYPKHNCIIPKQ